MVPQVAKDLQTLRAVNGFAAATSNDHAIPVAPPGSPNSSGHGAYAFRYMLPADVVEASLLRQIVSGPRARHPEAGLDLCYVTDNSRFATAIVYS